jgi:hypothetical protein
MVAVAEKAQQEPQKPWSTKINRSRRRTRVVRKIKKNEAPTY